MICKYEMIKGKDAPYSESVIKVLSILLDCILFQIQRKRGKLWEKCLE